MGPLFGVCLGLLGTDPAPPLRERVDQAKAVVAERAWGLDLSGFADWATYDAEDGRRRFGFGAAELDLGLGIGEWMELSGAYVGTREDQAWSAYFFDWHPFGGGTVAPRGALWVEKGFHIQVGRFDVPFGADFAYFASKDSPSISRPLTTALIMEGGYNDRGLRVLGNNGTVNFNAYALRGFGEGRLYGGRLGFTPLGAPFSLQATRDPKGLELGLSAFVQRAPGGGQAERAFAVDVEVQAGPLQILAEYLGRQRRLGEGPAPWQRGWHITPQWHFERPVPATAFFRYDRVWGATADGGDPAPASEPTVRVSVGLSTCIAGLVQAKVELQRTVRARADLREDPAYRGHRVQVQLVVVL